MLQISSTQKQKQFSQIFPRRFGVNTQNKLHLHGPPRCGKTCIALGIIKNFKNPIYIDFDDFRNSSELIKSYLLKITMEKKVDILVLDNLKDDFINLPNIANIITINEYKTSNTSFINKEILPLNFEEFISFDNQNQDINQLLNSFIKYGNLPYILNIKEYFKLESKQNMLYLVFKNNINIFTLLCRLQAQCVTSNQIYFLAKKEFKTSKDSIYSFIKDLQDRRILYLIESFSNPNLPKKVFFWDFSIKNAITYDKNFISTVENMVFLELLKLDKPIYYGDRINLICDKVGYVIAIFNTLEDIKESLSKIDLMDLEIIVITFELEGKININNKAIQIKSFINFALGE